MAKAKLISEVLEAVSKTQSRKEKIQILRDNNTLALRDILKGAFDDTVEFILPAGAPPIDEDDKSRYDAMIPLIQETKKFRYFVKGGPGEQVNKMRREKMFVDLLYRIDTKEVPVVCAMKDKTLGELYKTVTKKLIQEAFPGLIIR